MVLWRLWGAQAWLAVHTHAAQDPEMRTIEEEWPIGPQLSPDGSRPTKFLQPGGRAKAPRFEPGSPCKPVLGLR